jgi:hypothetical protein
MPISGHLSSPRAAKGATAIRHGMLPRDRADTEQVRQLVQKDAWQVIVTGRPGRRR